VIDPTRLDTDNVLAAGFWLVMLYQVGVAIAASIAIRLLTPKPKPPKPSSIGDFNVPTATEGRAIPVVWGTCLLRGGNVTWYGDLFAQEVLIPDPDMLVIKYHLGMDIALCHGPIDDVLEMRFDDRAHSTLVGAGGVEDFTHIRRRSFNSTANNNMFGGDHEGGGIIGTFDIHYGKTDQPISDYLASVTTSVQGAQQGICHCVARRPYWGTSAYIHPIAFVVARFPNQLGLTSGREDIAGDANPAAMLYELLTDERWGCGLDPANLDTASFIAAGNVLSDEGLGMSLVVDGESEAREVQEEIERHIDGVMAPDPVTGLWTLKLVRADYVPANLLLLDDSNSETLEFSRPSWPNTVNIVKVSYTDRAANFTERVVDAQDIANVSIQGKVVQEVSFNGLSNAVQAAKTAARVLNGSSYPFASTRIMANRQAWDLRQGDVFRWSSPAYGIVEMPLRVKRVRPGPLGDGKVEIEAVEDVFGVGWTSFAPPAGDWVDPAGEAQGGWGQIWGEYWGDAVA